MTTNGKTTKILRTISNEEYEAAYKNDQYRKIIGKAMSTFRIGRDEAIAIRDDALWMAMQSHDPERSKFETYLYKKTQWLCYREVWKRSPRNSVYNNKLKVLEDFNMKNKNATYDPIKECVNRIECEEILETLDERDRKLLVDRFYLSKNLKEMGTERGVTLQAVEQQIKNVLEKIKLRFSDKKE